MILLYGRTLFKTVSELTTHTRTHKLMFPIDCTHYKWQWLLHSQFDYKNFHRKKNEKVVNLIDERDKLIEFMEQRSNWCARVQSAQQLKQRTHLKCINWQQRLLITVERIKVFIILNDFDTHCLQTALPCIETLKLQLQPISGWLMTLFKQFAHCTWMQIVIKMRAACFCSFHLTFGWSVVTALIVHNLIVILKILIKEFGFPHNIIFRSTSSLNKTQHRQHKSMVWYQEENRYVCLAIAIAS